MLSWFGGAKPDHPLADPREASRILEDLPKDALRAIADVAFWLDSVGATPEFRVDRRYQLVDRLEHAARPHLRRLAQDYQQVRQQKFQENRLWSSIADLWRLIAAGYVHCIEGFQADAPGARNVRAELPVIVGRALHALGQRLNWLLQRYGPIEDELWGKLGMIYAFAEAKGLDDKTIALYEGALPSSARSQFAATMMLSAASTDSLLPAQIQIAERTVAYFAPRFAVLRAAQPGCTHRFDLAMRQPPRRVQAGESVGVSVRYVSAGEAYDEMARLLGVLRAEGALPSDVPLSETAEPRLVDATWQHLLQYWAPEAPLRRSQRNAVNARLTISPGMQGLLAALESGTPTVLDRAASPRLQDWESWVAEDASDGGYGAVVPTMSGDWLTIGALIGLKVETQPQWGAAIVRRVQRVGERECRVGIELLAPAALSIRLAPAGEISSFNATRDNDPGVLLSLKPDAEGRVRMLLPGGTFTAGQALEIRVRGQAYEVAPVRLLESGADYDMATFAVRRKIS